MNRINQLFQQKQSGLLDIYFCAGYPHLESTVPTLEALQDGGIDLVEIGIPFSDPMADGPVIQNAATQALKNGMSLRQLFAQLENVRPRITMPLILMGYLNVIYRYGFENFCQSCQRCGIDGAIIPDLPFDVYMKDYKAVADKYDIKIIMLITPETSPERIRLIDENTDGFIYRRYDRRAERIWAGNPCLFQANSGHEAQEPHIGGIWHLQQKHAAGCPAICSRCYHRKQVCQAQCPVQHATGSPLAAQGRPGTITPTAPTT